MNCYENPRTTLVIPDAHVGPDQDLTRFRKLGLMIVDRKPDRIISLGDFLTLESLSAWDLHKAGCMEGKRYQLDIDSGKAALNLLLEPLFELQERQRKNKDKIYRPTLVFIKGNHSDRLDRYLETKPELKGHLDLAKDLGLKELGFTIIPYRQSIEFDGVLFTHAPMQGNNQPVSGKFGIHRAAETTAKSLVYGHCFSDDTELLGENGWLKLEDLSQGTSIATVNPDTKAIEYQPVNEVFVYGWDGPLHYFECATMNHLVTPEHGMIVTNREGNWKHLAAKELVGTGYHFICSAFQNREDHPDWTDDEIRLLVQCITDGGNKCNPKYGYWRWHLKKERKIKRLSELLTRMGITFSAKLTKKGTTRIWVGTLPDKYQKQLPTDVRHFSRRQVDILLDEWSVTDGINYTEVSVQLSSSDKHNADMLQEILVKNGHKCNMSRRIVDGTNWKTNYVISISKNTERVRSDYTYRKQGLVDYKGKVFCVSVQNGNLFARRNGRVVLTQNSHKKEGVNYYRHGSHNLTQILTAGAFFEHTDDYAYGALNCYWRGLVFLTHWAEGRFDVEEISLERLYQLY